MPIYTRSSGAVYKPAPSGVHPAVCVDVVDLGQVKVEYAGKSREQYKIKIVWQIDELRDDGKPYTCSKRYTNSLHEKAALRKDLESWRGKAFTQDELAQFDLEALLSCGCLINVIHNTKEGSTYANVTGVMRLPKGMQAPSLRDYVREVDREPEAAPAHGLASAPAGWTGDPPPDYPPDYDDTVPF